MINNTALGKDKITKTNKLEGLYMTDLLSNKPLVILFIDNDLYLESKGEDKYKLVKDSGNLYQIDGIAMTIEFIEDTQHNFHSLVLANDKRSKTYTKKQVLEISYKKIAHTVRPHGLSDAIILKDIASAKILIKAGIDLYELDTRKQIGGKSGRRPLNWAAIENNTDMIQLLLNAGTDVNKTNLSGFTPLHHAVESKSFEAAQLLLKHGANLNLKTKDNYTALEIAAIRNDEKMIALLQSSQ